MESGFSSCYFSANSGANPAETTWSSLLHRRHFDHRVNDDEHLVNLEAVFQSLKQYWFRLKRSKCWFFQESVEYLVDVVSKEGIQTSKRKIEAILKVKTPTNRTELKSFLGMANHYGKFIPCLADLSSPLNNLLKKAVQWNWSEECQESFEKLREILTSTLPTTQMFHLVLPVMPVEWK